MAALSRQTGAHEAGSLTAAGAPATACAACGATGLVAHLRVGRAAVAEDLSPTIDSFGAALSDIVRCPACGHRQLAAMPAEADLFDRYADAVSEVYVEEEAGQRETARRVLARAEAHLGGGGRRLADLGCWVGFLLAEARGRGWVSTGVEPSEFASAFARDRLGMEVLTDDLFTAALPAGTFDAVILGDVIEHLPRPGDALDCAASLLAPGGVIVLMLPDAGSRVARALGRRWWSILPTHVHYFTRGSLATLLRRHGFTPLEVTTHPKVFTVEYYLSRVGGYSPPVARLLVRAARAAGVAQRMWAPDFRDRMLVVARAPSGPAAASP